MDGSTSSLCNASYDRRRSRYDIAIPWNKSRTKSEPEVAIPGVFVKFGSFNVLRSMYAMVVSQFG